MKYLLRFSVFEQGSPKLDTSPTARFKNSLPQGSFDDLRGKCIREEIWPFVNYVLKHKNFLLQELKIDSKTLIQLTKASVGLIGNETFFGRYTTTSDKQILSTLEKPGLASSALSWGFSLTKEPSLGMAQFKKQTWDHYGLDKKIGDYYKSAKNPKFQGLGVLYSLCERYKLALKKGLKNEPSENQILQKYGVIKSIDGTGSNALDLSILAHNYGEWLVTKWCETSNPLFSSPVGKTEIEPFKTEQEFKNWASDSALMKKITDPNLKRFPGKLKTFPGKIIPNYYPNLSTQGDSRSQGGKVTSIGYLERVCEYMKELQCLDGRI